MITKHIAIVLGDKAIDRVCAQGRTLDECFDQAFQWADKVHGINKEYELFELDNPRHAILFEKELNDLF